MKKIILTLLFLAVIGSTITVNAATIAQSCNSVGSDEYSGHTCAVLSNGTINCWGRNDYGQLGDETTTNSANPVSVNGINNALSVATSTSSSCALLLDGTIKCWGGNGQGQLGNGTTIDSLTPVTVTGINNAIKIAGGQNWFCTILSDKTIKCWGDNTSAQLGSGAGGTISSTPIAVPGINNATDIELGFLVSCAVLSNGTIKCWGNNAYKQISESYNDGTPTLINGINNAVEVAIGLGHTCTVLSDGTIKCWGLNDTGQLGNGDTSGGTSTNTPNTVIGITNAIDVSNGFRHSCALLADGTIKCWGDSSNKQAGTWQSSPPFNTTPVNITGISNAIGIIAGYRHSCSLLSDGTINCWGTDGAGQPSSYAPVQVIGIGGSNTTANTCTTVPISDNTVLLGIVSAENIMENSSPILNIQFLFNSTDSGSASTNYSIEISKADGTTVLTSNQSVSVPDGGTVIAPPISDRITLTASEQSETFRAKVAITSVASPYKKSAFNDTKIVYFTVSKPQTAKSVPETSILLVFGIIGIVLAILSKKENPFQSK